MSGRALASIARTIDGRVIKKAMRRLLMLGLASKAFVLLETTGWRTGLARRTPVDNGLVGEEFWLIAARGDAADYVKNLRDEPAVRVKVGRRWLRGTAEVLPDDDPERRLAYILAHFGWLRRLDAKALTASIRTLDSTPRVVRIRLDGPSTAAPSSPVGARRDPRPQ